MAAIVQAVVNKYNYIIHELADPRTQQWWGISNPLFIFTIVPAYLYFCQSLGPRLMKNREPFVLRKTLIVYNLFQVLMSLYLTYIGTLYIWHKEYSWTCDVVDYSNKPRALFVAAGAWWYYFAKITELLDTVLFVLRKKYNQVTFLHVYHHASMAFFTWFGVKYIPGGHVIFMGYLNSMVHVMMYTYYLLSGLGPQYQKYLWWKKHVTKVQLVQFVIVFIHNFMVFFYDCAFPRVINVLCCISAISFIYMFGSFYIRSYNTDRERKSKLQVKSAHKITKKVSEVEQRKEKEKSR